MAMASLKYADLFSEYDCRGLSHCSLEGIADIRGEIDSNRTFIETGGDTAHGRWSYGSAQVIGTSTCTNLSHTCTYRIAGNIGRN